MREDLSEHGAPPLTPLLLLHQHPTVVCRTIPHPHFGMLFGQDFLHPRSSPLEDCIPVQWRWRHVESLPPAKASDILFYGLTQRCLVLPIYLFRDNPQRLDFQSQGALPTPHQYWLQLFVNFIHFYFENSLLPAKCEA